jgi:hypothetical protein
VQFPLLPRRPPQSASVLSPPLRALLAALAETRGRLGPAGVGGWQLTLPLGSTAAAEGRARALARRLGGRYQRQRRQHAVAVAAAGALGPLLAALAPALEPTALSGRLAPALAALAAAAPASAEGSTGVGAARAAAAVEPAFGLGWLLAWGAEAAALEPAAAAAVAQRGPGVVLALPPGAPPLPEPLAGAAQLLAPAPVAGRRSPLPRHRGPLLWLPAASLAFLAPTAAALAAAEGLPPATLTPPGLERAENWATAPESAGLAPKGEGKLVPLTDSRRLRRPVGGYSSVVERDVVVVEAGGSIPLTRPAAAGGLRMGRCHPPQFPGGVAL